jgi:hypothetical protein
VVGWTEKFLDILLNKYTIDGNFTPEGINEYLEKETNFYDKYFRLNENIITLKIYRLFLRGFFERWLEINDKNIKGRKSYFRYSFSDKSKKLVEDYGSFKIAFNQLKGGN